MVTIFTPLLSSSNLAPDSVYLPSSCVIAKMLRSIKSFNSEAGNLSGVDLNPGSSGNVSFEIPGKRNLDRSHSTVTHSFSSFRNLTGASGSSLAMSNSFRAWTQMAPCDLISSASASHLIVTSKSVPLIRIASSPADSIRIFASTGIVFFRSTTP